MTGAVSFCQISPISMSRLACHVSRALQCDTHQPSCPGLYHEGHLSAWKLWEVFTQSFLYINSCFINWLESVLCSIWLHLDIYHQFSIHCCVSTVQGLMMRDPLMVRGDVIRWNDHSIDAETARDARASDSEASIKSINLLWSWVHSRLSVFKLH